MLESYFQLILVPLRTYVFIACLIFFFSSCKKDDLKFDQQTIRISSRSNANWESVNIYSVVRGKNCDSLLIHNISESKDTVVLWKDINTADEDAWFELKVTLSDNKLLKAYGGQRDDLPYSAITLNMDVAVYSDSVKVISY